MPAFIELLPPTKSEPHGAIEFVPCEDAADRFVIGVLTVSGKRTWCRYRVAESASGWAGRSFVLKKLDAGSDKTVEMYTCMTTANGLGIDCSCRGFQGTGACKHLRSLETLVVNGQL